jgi:SAM-dependent methyltransferase
VAQTWHYGLVATWWDEFNQGGPEVDFFRRFVEAGQPALDVACGTGRLLLPYLRAGLDVDGCDISEDMLERCRERAAREGLSPPRLYAQPMHRLELPRRYRTILLCGGFGLGGRRDEDVEGLQRIFDHLEPGGTFVVDNEVPYAPGNGWSYWTAEGRAELPRAWSEPKERRRASDGSELALNVRCVDMDPLSQRITYQMRAWLWRDGRSEPVEQEEHELQMTLYLTQEIVLLLERAGFVDVELRAGDRDEPPTRDDAFVVFVARQP